MSLTVNDRETVQRETARASTVAALAPDRESDDPAVLAAFYSGFAYAEHYRKVVLSQCREIVRARYALRNERVTESRLDDLARTHPIYLSYLEKHLQGRILWEEEVKREGGMR
jgi:hypothetical protein